MFGFKKNSSTVICISILLDTIEYYNDNTTDCYMGVYFMLTILVHCHLLSLDLEMLKICEDFADDHEIIFNARQKVNLVRVQILLT